MSTGEYSINYDESLVGEVNLPDPLTAADGRAVTDPADWEKNRRPEILELFHNEVYGRMPGSPDETEYRLISKDKNALGGVGVREEICAEISTPLGSVEINILVFLPSRVEGPVPVFAGLNFSGNHTVCTDGAVSLPDGWVSNDESAGIADHHAKESQRGKNAGRWPIELILSRGYGVATAYCGDIDPDYDDGFFNGVHSLFPRDTGSGSEWGTIGAWAWGLHRIIDYLEMDSSVDSERIALIGHSRLGKTALWAAATDPRAALVVSNNSGCGGASLSRRNFGETVARINGTFPHWFCRNFHKYGEDPTRLPIDQHMLIALMAPRPAYIASAEDDLWADPKGEFLSALHAAPVYRLLGHGGLSAESMPDVNAPVTEGRIGYHIRSGGHDATEFDWRNYMDFADRKMTRR